MKKRSAAGYELEKLAAAIVPKRYQTIRAGVSARILSSQPRL